MNTPQLDTVFIVDDNTAAGDSTATLLHSLGLPTALFESAEAFLAATENTISGCVISDFLMEGNCNGIELLKQMQVLGYKIPVIIASGSFNQSSRAEAGKSGAYAVFDKPYDPRVLCKTVRSALNKLD